MERPVAKLKCLACGYEDYRMSGKPIGDLFPESCPRCHRDMVIESRDELPESLETVTDLVEKNFKIWDFVISPEQMEFLVESENQKKSFSTLLEKLEGEGYLARMDKSDGELKLLVKERSKQGKSNVLINIILFLATVVTTFGVAGYWYLYGDLLNAALFSSALLTILGAHELGHKIATWQHGVDATWPYFLPVPHPLIGTFGAVIKNKSPIPSKEGLIDMGASGPLFGVAFAIPITIVGLSFSEPVGGNMFQTIPTPLIFSLIGTSIFGEFPLSLNPHPLAWAGFIGLLVTWLNLLPTGQLDGGHIARGFLSQENHFALTRSIGLTLLLLSFAWPGFLILALLILFIVGSPHPGALDNISKLEKNRKIIAALAFTVFILCLPIPMWMV